MRRLLAVGLGAAFLIGACGDDGGSAEAWCREFQQFQEDGAELENPDIPSGASSEDLANALRDSFAAVRDGLDDLRDAAPSEIDDDVDTMAEGLTKLLEASEDPSPENQQELEGLNEDFRAASDRVEQYTEEQCDTDRNDVPPGGDATGGDDRTE